MNWHHAVSRARGVCVSISDIGRVGQPEFVIVLPELKKKQNMSVVMSGLGGGSRKSPMCGK